MVLYTRWPQPCGCVLTVIVDKHGTVHGAMVGQPCALHGTAEALRAALRDLLDSLPAGDDQPCCHARAREALQRADPPAT